MDPIRIDWVVNTLGWAPTPENLLSAAAAFVTFNVELANGDLDLAVYKLGEIQKMFGSGRAEDARQKAAEFRGA